MSSYAIDPPTIEDTDFTNEVCTTVCPNADGMTHTTAHGETFKMDCGKRHGTMAFEWSYAEDFLQCIETCGALVPCHSVDYQERTKKVSD